MSSSPRTSTSPDRTEGRRPTGLKAIHRGFLRGSVVRRVRERVGKAALGSRGDAATRAAACGWESTEELFDSGALDGKYGAQRALMEAARVAQQGPSLSSIVAWCAIGASTAAQKDSSGGDASNDDVEALRMLTTALCIEPGRAAIVDFADHERTLADACAATEIDDEAESPSVRNREVASQLTSDERFVDISAAAMVSVDRKASTASLRRIVINSRGCWMLRGEAPFATMRVWPWPSIAGVEVDPKRELDATYGCSFTLRVLRAASSSPRPRLQSRLGSSFDGDDREERFAFAAQSEAERAALVHAILRRGTSQFATSRHFVHSGKLVADTDEEFGHWTYINVSSAALGQIGRASCRERVSTRV
jgi:hypothetical protein